LKADFEDAVMPTKKKLDTAGRRPSAARRVKTLTVPTESEIASRAYELFIRRGSQHGRDWEDWLLAECELRPSDGG
jgi:Protein of unknown function (DUF2934)